MHIWHDGLRYKLQNCNFPTKLVRLISSYITDRQIKVKIRDIISNPVNLEAGTPQGSVLSPLLFLIYVNDIPNHNQTEMSQFADDLGLWTSDKNSTTVENRLQRAINELEIWCSKWRIKLNARKTQLIMFQNRNKYYPITIKLFDERIPPTDEATLLGVTFDKKLKFECFLQKLRKRFSSKLSLMCRLRGTNWGTNPETLLRLYKAFIRPILEYAAPILLCLTKTRMKKLQVLQNKALRMALKAHYRTRITTLHEQSGVEYIEDRLKTLANKAYSRIKDNPLFQDTILLNELHKRNNKLTLLDKINP